ncbi:DUF4391 domain-containing protein [Cytobacillus sp. S13-E01]|uniref:DUF4391 domain-containing protein n=1 Tax=Cytobacillus sp. S13-E01 TaxID=3031326 RepID=UPI0023D88370|nr:DUF4391 domain-containing protein [Cytobacillus sp. S13-E01]MDF0728959.1 DUF4391 domain-containing protein [Cytobacillus sp. S13-E01]
MVASRFYEMIGLDSKLQALQKKLDKKMFYEYADLNKKEKDVITKHIERIELTYLLTPTTINIQPYITDEFHYEGVMFITVFLREESTEKHVNIVEEVIHGALPNPIIIVFQLNDKIIISTCMKRLNKVDKSSVVLNNIHRTAWLTLEDHKKVEKDFIGSVNISNLDFNNFYAFYKDLDLAVEAFENSETLGYYHEERDVKKHEQQQQIIQKIKELEAELKKIKMSIKKESQFNKKVELNVKVQEINRQIADLKEELN